MEKPIEADVGAGVCDENDEKAAENHELVVHELREVGSREIDSRQKTESHKSEAEDGGGAGRKPQNEACSDKKKQPLE